MTEPSERSRKLVHKLHATGYECGADDLPGCNSGCNEAKDALLTHLATLESQVETAREALEKIGAFDDEASNNYLERTGRYSHFDHPASVRIARQALQDIEEDGDDG